MRSRILVVGQDVALRARLARTLSAAGYGVEIAENAAHARRVERTGLALAIVVPGGLGRDADRLLDDLQTAIGRTIMLADAPDEADLLARVAEALRPIAAADEAAPVLQFAGYSLDLAGHSLANRAGKEIPLTHGEFRLLREFVQRPGRVLSRDHLLQALVGRDAEAFDRSIDMLIVRLRRKIERDPKTPSLIVTVAGTGYKFAAKVATANAPPEPVAAPPGLAAVTAERRQVTMLCAEVIPTQSGGAPADPEDLQVIIDHFRRRAAAVANRHGGVLAHGRAREVVAYFGHPVAQEDAPERAIHAALELTRNRGERDAEIPVGWTVRAGIATGLVIANHGGEFIGDAPSEAAGLQAMAEPGQVLVAPGTRRLVGRLFDYQAVAQAWRVVAENRALGRFEALHSGATPMVGRDEELAMLLRRWQQTKESGGRVVVIFGEPGIGKSRLTAALLDRLAGEPHTRLRYFCSPQHTDSAFYPIIVQLERAAGLTYDDPPQAKFDKLAAMLALSATSIQDAALFAELLSLPNDDHSPARELAPEQRRQRTLEALTAQLTGLARKNPVLMVLEDAHWADPTSLEAFGRAVDRIETLPALLIATFRPESNAPWVGQPHVTSLTLNRLGERDAAAIVAGLAESAALPADVMTEIVERSDGIPLFVEEMTKAMLEAESENAARCTVASVPSPARAVPASLHASLMARLDRLGPAKEVAQIGSAIGRKFPHALLASVARKPEPELGAALDRLIQAGLLSRQGMSPQASYLFKHALVRDAAYGTLLREPRRALHTRIAETLESQFAEMAESQPELLAHHCAEAGLIEKAASLWGKAGQQSLTRSALVEATAQLTRALAHTAALPTTPALRREQIKLQVALITPLLHVKGYAAPETKAAAERARLLIEQAEALGEPLDDPLLLFSVLYGFWVANYVAFNGDAVRDLAAQFLALAEKQRATAPVMIGHRLMGTSSLFTGDITEGWVHYNQAIALYDPIAHRPLAARFAQDVRVAILSNRPLALWLLGYPDAGRRDSEDAIREAREIGQAGTLMYALGYAAIIYTLFGNYVSAAAKLQEGISLGEENGALFWKAAAMMNQGWVFVLTDRASDAIDALSSGITAWRSTGATFWMPLYLPQLARAEAKIEQFDNAWHHIDEAMTVAETTKEKWCEAELHRIVGEITLLSPDPDAAKAEAYFDSALVIARAQKARSWELRAAMSMARLWRDQGKWQQARNLLAPVYGWFTEGFDTADLIEAKALLEILAAN